MSLKDCIEHLYSWDYTIQDSYGCPGCAEQERIIKLIEEWGEKAGCFCCASDAAASEIIAFIKGEITSENL